MLRWGVLVTVSAVAFAVPAVAATTGPRLRGGDVMLANLDDDEHRCVVTPADLDAVGLETDRRLAACGDAADDRVNGPADEQDLTPLEIAPEPWLGGGAVGRLTIDRGEHARVFARRGGGFDSIAPGDGTLSAAELRRGVRLAVEGRDIVRDLSTWDGSVTVTLTVTDRGSRRSASHRLRTAPLVLQNDLQPATTVFAGAPGTGPGGVPGLPGSRIPAGWPEFSASLDRAAGPRVRYLTGGPAWWADTWTQDIFEPATASMPTPHGVQTMRVLLRSANLWQVGETATLRPAGRLAFRDLRGPGVAVVQAFSDVPRIAGIDLLNATGNFESLPPYPGFPRGRVLYGSGRDNKRRPDPVFVRMLESQRVQPPLAIDTSWLAIGHVDELVHVVPAPNARGWTLMVADPRLASGILATAKARGAGSAALFSGTAAAEKPTVDELVNDRKLNDANERAAAHIDREVSVLLAETGLRADELVRAPVLFHELDGTPLLLAFTPDIPNGLSVTAHEFAAPDPHGPVVGGRDLFRVVTERALARHGVRVRWVEDFSWAHEGGGEVHCTTNALRDVSVH
ncbi:protein-arginine deiminase family protein [Amycolatopsis minnesotensis]|uniref:Protein-arginine deiminase C-terminal domain-containing protein n=1 Tax=Amycolatopsis minnesotensis TaxID=337894 RepID=A0ABP5CGP1_9PSEU